MCWVLRRPKYYLLPLVLIFAARQPAHILVEKRNCLKQSRHILESCHPMHFSRAFSPSAKWNFVGHMRSVWNNLLEPHSLQKTYETRRAITSNKHSSRNKFVPILLAMRPSVTLSHASLPSSFCIFGEFLFGVSMEIKRLGKAKILRISGFIFSEELEKSTQERRKATNLLIFCFSNFSA